MAAKEPLAFLSYAHFDDQYEQGRLLQFAERLSGEVRLQWGDEFPIFIDRKNLKWGQQWKARIEQSLDGVTFLIAILTPGYFKSDFCRKELLRFLDREKQLSRSDLILPVYYVRCSILEDGAKRQADELATLLSERQYNDWRHLRHEPWTTPEIGRQFEGMALEIIEAMERGGLEPGKPRTATKSEAKPSSAVGKPGSKGAADSNEPKDSAKSSSHDPPTVTVDAMNRGDFTTISDGIRTAEAGTRILVRPGTYRESLTIDKVVEIVGEGNTDDTVVQCTGSDLIKFTAPMGRIANLTLRQMGGGLWDAVDVISGRLDLEDCDITSRGRSAVAIHGGADPRLRRNRIHDCPQPGVFVYEKGAGLIEDNEIFGGELSGIEIKTGANPTVRRNRIYDGRQGGILVGEHGSGVIEDNEIFGNALAAIEINTKANPIVRRNRIHDGKGSGIFAHNKATGVIEENDIIANASSGVIVTTGANPIVRNNRIKGNRAGVRVQDGGAGTFEGNEFSNNKRGAWDIAADREASVKRSGNIES